MCVYIYYNVYVYIIYCRIYFGKLIGARVPFGGLWFALVSIWFPFWTGILDMDMP